MRYASLVVIDSMEKMEHHTHYYTVPQSSTDTVIYMPLCICYPPSLVPRPHPTCISLPPHNTESDPRWGWFWVWD